MADTNFTQLISNVLSDDKLALEQFMARANVNDLTDDEVAEMANLIRAAMNNPKQRAIANFLLGLSLDLGLDGQVNKQLATPYYIVAVNEGHPQAMYRLALAMIAQEVKDGYEIAAYLLEIASKLGDVDAMYTLFCLYTDMGVLGDSRKALDHYLNYLDLKKLSPDRDIMRYYQEKCMDNITHDATLSNLFEQLYTMEEQAKALAPTQGELLYEHLLQLHAELNEFLASAFSNLPTTADIDAFKKQFTDSIQNKDEQLKAQNIEWEPKAQTLKQALAPIDFIKLARYAIDNSPDLPRAFAA